jgi:hypothetical protein
MAPAGKKWISARDCQEESAILAVVIVVSSSIGERWDFVSAMHHVIGRTESSVMMLLLIVAGIEVDA